MSTHLSAEEVLLNYQRIMGVELGLVFHNLRNEVIYLHQQWNTFSDLFGIEESRIELMNQSAPSFFWMLQSGLLENIIISIARITDPLKSGKFNNLTLRLIPKHLTDNKLKKEIELGLEMIVLPSVDFAREARKKFYAHRDYDVSLGRATISEKATRERIKIALKVIRDLMDKITLHYEDSRTVYQSDVYTSGSNTLLFVLQDGINCREYIKKKSYEGEEIDIILKRNRITNTRREYDI